VGSETPPAQPRAEPRGVNSIATEYETRTREYERVLRETLDREEGGVQGLRDERKGGERSGEDTVESLGSRMERGSRW